MANAILNFHFDFLNPSLTYNTTNAIDPEGASDERDWTEVQVSTLPQGF